MGRRTTQAYHFGASRAATPDDVPYDTNRTNINYLRRFFMPIEERAIWTIAFIICFGLMLFNIQRGYRDYVVLQAIRQGAAPMEIACAVNIPSEDICTIYVVRGKL